jgi:cyclopropane-fatty-acyl-phospholipid synthase
MSNNFLKAGFQEYLSKAGIQINGSHPWDIHVHNDQLYKRLASEGALGFGEAYMEGWWDCQQLDVLAFRACQLDVNQWKMFKFKDFLQWLKIIFINLQSKRRAFIVGQQHYDLNDQLFQLMLDKRMTYSCGYWKNAGNLDEAQEAKLELICRKLYLKAGMKVLDIGCGWGSFAKYAAEKYGVSVVGITISQNQLSLGRQLCQGYPIELRLQDYRELNQKFDRVVSIGQMEHVGYKNYVSYMKIVKRCLNEGGLFLLHTIGNNLSFYSVDPWIAKYIFPNGQIPSLKQIVESTEGIFVMEDWHNFGYDYDRTLMAWYENFKNHWQSIKVNIKNSEKFYRMWSFYLLCCAGAFRARKLQLWQIIFSHEGMPKGYQSIR